MSENRKRWVLAAIVAVAVAISAYTSARLLLQFARRDIFASALLASPVIAIASGYVANVVTDLCPKRFLPARWRAVVPILYEAAALAVVGAILFEAPPVAWFTIVIATVGTHWQLNLHDSAAERAADDAAWLESRQA